MFALVFFHEDQQFDCINVKKLTKCGESSTAGNFEVGDRISAPYKLRVLDEVGIEKLTDFDYEGTVVFLDKGNENRLITVYIKLNLQSVYNIK